ncbi:hypothetical protein [Herbidospora mongoliensis]|uniref:hypothetical protein n=1 Tax=Herbidospora mongoliensis TaxID=688067 RepID=UPI00082D31B9|nr:hypothetical protein [Herbidospora mongoliensis]
MQQPTPDTFNHLAVGDRAHIPGAGDQTGRPLPDPVEIVTEPVPCTLPDCGAWCCVGKDQEGWLVELHRRPDRPVFIAARAA